MGQEPAAVEQARKLLYKRLKINITDGRQLIGDFQCLDKQGNIILSNTYEQCVEPNAEKQGKTTERHMGLVLVPSKHIASCHVEVMPDQLPWLQQLIKRPSSQTLSAISTPTA